VPGSDGKSDLTAGGLVFIDLNAGPEKHAFAGLNAGSISVLVIRVDQCADAALDDGLGALVTGEQRDIELCAFQRTAPVV